MNKDEKDGLRGGALHIIVAHYGNSTTYILHVFYN